MTDQISDILNLRHQAPPMLTTRTALVSSLPLSILLLYSLERLVSTEAATTGKREPGSIWKQPRMKHKSAQPQAASEEGSYELRDRLVCLLLENEPAITSTP